MIKYQSFCWVIGTTSFRTAKINLKIEEQLKLLDQFYKITTLKEDWNWNSDLQEKYYNFLKDKNFLKGIAKRKDKDAREKTSALVDIGLITDDRRLSEVGRELLEITDNKKFNKDNLFNISSDSFIYLKQLLKMSKKTSSFYTRPLIIVLKCLNELDYLNYKEFTYLIPLILNPFLIQDMLDMIKAYRRNEISIEDIIYRRLMKMENYKIAYEEFSNKEVSESVITLIGMNRKSRKYDLPYYELYLNLKAIFLNKSRDYKSLLSAIEKVKHSAALCWKNLIFNRSKSKLTILEDCPFSSCNTEEELKKEFFKYLHVYKAMATLNDYFDLNKRYFNLTDIIIFDDTKVELDIFAKYYFKKVIDGLFKDAFNICDLLDKNIELNEISESFDIDIKEVYDILNNDLSTNINNPNMASEYIQEQRYKRFNKLIDEHFSDEVLIQLLHCFKNRLDKRIEELVTSEASIPTIFEYIIAIIWYKISDRKGKILDYMRLSLYANLLPKTHASGGFSDIIYEYEECEDYPKHKLLIEATLNNDSNQRKAEEEPVIRHLAKHIKESNNPFDYTLFISSNLSTEVYSEFRNRKNSGAFIQGEYIENLKILSLSTSTLKLLIQDKKKYNFIYKIFDKYHEIEIEDPRKIQEWQKELIGELTHKYE